MMVIGLLVAVALGVLAGRFLRSASFVRATRIDWLSDPKTRPRR